MLRVATCLGLVRGPLLMRRGMQCTRTRATSSPLSSHINQKPKDNNKIEADKEKCTTQVLIGWTFAISFHLLSFSRGGRNLMPRTHMLMLDMTKACKMHAAPRQETLILCEQVRQYLRVLYDGYYVRTRASFVLYTGL
jgi:hypothetical protein